MINDIARDEATLHDVAFFTADGHIRPLINIEADVINLAIVHYDGCLREAARRLRIGRSTIYRKIDARLPAA